MSLGLFPPSTFVYSLNKSNKIDAGGGGSGGFPLRALSEKFESPACGISRPTQASVFLAGVNSSVEGSPAAAHRRQRSPYRGTISSSQLHQQQPYISGIGGAKRKLSSIEREEQDMQQPKQFVGTSTSASSDDDEFGSSAFQLGAEPKAKQRRYEERMSTKLSGIQLKDEHMSNKRNAPFAQQPWGEMQNQPRSGPIIEEITDWTQLGDQNQLLFEDESNFQNRSAVPVVEEPDEGYLKERECRSADAEKSSASRPTVRHTLVDEEKQDEDNELNLDGGLSSEEGRRIELSPELRNLISSMHGSNGGKGDGPLTTIGRSIRTGKELIPFVPPMAFLSSTPLGLSTSPSPNEDDEPACVEEVLDDEILPDAVGTPQVHSDSEENNNLLGNTEEDLMEMD